MKLLLAFIILVLLLIYEKAWRPMVCKKKIYSHIDKLGGQIDSIEKLTPRDEIYNVYYTVSGCSKHLNVKFDLFYKTKWK
jgi:septation ring formation regulator EzrA